MHLLSVQISSLWVCSVQASDPDVLLSIRIKVRVSCKFTNILIIFKEPTSKRVKKFLSTLTYGLKSYPPKCFWAKLQIIVLKFRLSTCVKNLEALNERLNMYINNSRVAHTRCTNHKNPNDWKSHSWTPLSGKHLSDNSAILHLLLHLIWLLICYRTMANAACMSSPYQYTSSEIFPTMICAPSPGKWPV